MTTATDMAKALASLKGPATLQDVLPFLCMFETLVERLETVRDLSEGRRHYDGDEHYQALGDITEIVDAVLGPKPATDTYPLLATCTQCGEQVKVKARSAGFRVETHDAPRPCRRVCSGSGQMFVFDTPSKKRKKAKRR